MNLPNKLTVARICMIPLFMVFLLIPFSFGGKGETVCRVAAAFLFLAAAITDHLDGKIARKRQLVTDFGKFLDPLADKMMVLGALIGLIVLAGRGASTTEGGVYYRLTATLCFLILFRELAVTSLRLAVSGSKGVVIAANILGKIKIMMGKGSSYIILVLISGLRKFLEFRHDQIITSCTFTERAHVIMDFFSSVHT